MAAWLRHKGIAPTPLTVDALIHLLRHLQGEKSPCETPSEH